MNKPGGLALPAAFIVKAAQTAARRADALHRTLATALEVLEAKVLVDRELRQEQLRKRNVLLQRKQQEEARARGDSSRMEEEQTSTTGTYLTRGGIDRNDPILAWSSLHQAAGLWNE